MHDRWIVCPRSPAWHRWKRGPQKQGIGRSRGRNTTKIHAIVDALGNPILIYLTGGQISDCTPAIDLMNLFDLENSYVLADKGYDSKEFVPIEAKGGIPVIPSRKNAKQPRSYDQYVYIGTDV